MYGGLEYHIDCKSADDFKIPLKLTYIYRAATPPLSSSEFLRKFWFLENLQISSDLLLP